MKLNHIFFKLLSRGRSDSLPEVTTAKKLLKEIRSTYGAETLALQAAANTNSVQAENAIKGVEQQLAAAYAKLLTRTEAVFSSALDRLEVRLTRLLASTAPDHLDAVACNCTVEITRLHSQSRPVLIDARRSERRRWLELRAFRFRHRLNREARYPESRTLHYSTLAFVCVVEALANTWAFAQGSDLGIVGGMAQALLVAAVNVAFAFFAGRAASGLYHRNWGIKTPAAGLVAGWAVFEAVYALTVAHYRIALMGDPDTAPRVALERMATAPLAIDDVTSILLTIFTLAFGVAALLTGLATDDRYPGYGACTRAHKSALARLESLRLSHLGAIDAIYLPGRSRLAAITAGAAGVTDTYRQTVERLKRTAASLEHALSEVNGAYRQAALTAREVFANVTGKSGAPQEAPTPLAKGCRLHQARLAIEEAEKILTNFPNRLASLENKRTAAERRLQNQHSKALKAIPAFFARTEQLAETASDYDERDACRRPPYGKKPRT